MLPSGALLSLGVSPGIILLSTGCTSVLISLFVVVFADDVLFCVSIDDNELLLAMLSLATKPTSARHKRTFFIFTLINLGIYVLAEKGKSPMNSKCCVYIFAIDEGNVVVIN